MRIVKCERYVPEGGTLPIILNLEAITFVGPFIDKTTKKMDKDSSVVAMNNGVVMRIDIPHGKIFSVMAGGGK